jgi:hypothetical protein
MSLKKQCFDTYNMGIMDPSIALDQPIAGDKNDVLSTVSYYTSSGKKRKKLTDSDHAEGNSYATYAFQYQPKTGISLTSKDSMKCLSTTDMKEAHSCSKVASHSEFPLFTDYLIEEVDDQNAEFNDFDEELYPSDDGSVASTSATGDELGTDGEHIDDTSSDEDVERNAIVVRDSLKELANDLRRRQGNSFHLSPEVQMLMDLYLKTVGRGASLNTFDDVLDWAIRHSLVDSHVPTRQPLLKQISNALYGKKFLKRCQPRQVRINLCTGRVAEVTIFDIRTVLVDLLCNEDLVKRDNLVFRGNDFSDVDQAESDDNPYNDVNSGTWWSATVSQMKRDHPDVADHSVLWPLILFIDGVSHGEFTNLSQEPVLITFSAFKREIRNKPQAWRPLAYIDYKGNLKGKVTAAMALNEYHQVLGTVFNAISEVQATGMNWSFTFDNETQMDAVLFFPIQFIIGDCEGHDKLCGRFSSHNNTPGLVRDCDIPTSLGDDANHICHFYTTDEMKRFTDDELKARSFHRIISPCHENTDFGASDQGINGASMPENHHAYLAGSCKEVGDIYPTTLSSASLTHTDNVMSHMVQTTRFPPALKLPVVSPFRSGLEKVHKLKAVERIGKIFAIYCLLMSSTYVRYLYDHPKVGVNAEEMLAELGQQVKVLEKMLCFHDWLFAEEHRRNTIDPDDVGNDPLSLTKIRDLMHGIKIYFPRSQGMGWKLTKFHQLLHYPHNIRRHGSALNFDGGRPEYYGKYFCKDMTTRTQRRQISLGKQTAKRYFETSCLLEAERVLANRNALLYMDKRDYQYLPRETGGNTNHTTTADATVSHQLKAKLCCLSIDPEDQRNLIFEWSNKKYSKVDGYKYEPLTYRSLAKRIWYSRNGGRLEMENGIVQCFSECLLPDGSIVRAHPLYNSERPWHDWVLVRWDDYGEPLPAKVMMLFSISSGEIENYNIVGDSRVPHETTYLEVGKNYALVKTVTGDDFNYRTLNENRKFHMKSSIAKRYNLESNMRLIEVEAIESLAFVIMDSIGSLGEINNEEDNESIIFFQQRERWKDLFLEL